VAFWSACGSAVAILFSIAVSQSLLGVAIAAFLLSGERPRLPRPWLPLALFLLGSMISLLASGEPMVGMPQVRKLYVYLVLVVFFSVIRKTSTARNLLLAWCGLGGAISFLGIAQFLQRIQEARSLHRDFYRYYMGNERITGFMSHWMTFSGEQMIALVILAAFLLFGPRQRGWRLAGWIVAVCAMAIALVLTDTRSAWIATFAAVLYLTWSRKKILVAAVPVLAFVAFLVAPHTIQERVQSIAKPHGDVDSNDFRKVVWRTGLRIIAAHPLLGLGPEEVHKQFYEWLPPDTPRPLPSGYYGHLHSIYVHYAAERGIPTMLMLMWMLGMIVYDSGRGLRRLRGLPPGENSDARFLLHAGIACVIAIMIEGFFELNLGDSEVLTMFLVTTACVYVGIEETRRVHREA
jgi:putative inorganic carbon (hco3(-)) transporter